MNSGSSSTIHLDVQPLAPTPELFLRSVRRILDSPYVKPREYVSLHLTPVFPFQDRDDGLAYDEKLFSQLFAFGDRIGVRIYLDHPFWIPGKQDWRLGLDERGEDAFPFLSARLSETISDILSLSAKGIRAVELMCELSPSIREKIEDRLREDIPDSSLEIHWLQPGSPEKSISPGKSGLIPILPGKLWLEQLSELEIHDICPEQVMNRIHDSQYPGFPRLRAAWTRWMDSIPGGLFQDSASLINRLQRGSSRHLWPFSSVQTAVNDWSNGDGIISSFRELEEELNRSIKHFTEDAWYERFMMTLNLVQKRILQTQGLG